ncbi:MAG: ABC transporter ATP-binding protein [Planctomycetaceae bacterium]
MSDTTPPPNEAAPLASPVLRVTGLRMSRGTLPVLQGVDLDLPPAGVGVLMGASGSGKSTLLRCITGLEAFQAGEIEVCDQRCAASDPEGVKRRKIAAIRQSVGMVFQQFHLFPHLSVIENVTEAPIHVRGVVPEVARAAGRELLERVGLGSKLESFPDELSGGQQQRVAIARAIVTRPRVLLADEPTGNLDSQRSHEIMELIQRLNRERGITVLMVTHEPDIAAYAGRIVRFVDGRVESDRPNPHPAGQADREAHRCS